MKIVYLLTTADSVGGTEKTIFQQASFMARHHKVEILSLYRSTARRPGFQLDPRVRISYIMDRPQLELGARESLLVPRDWDNQFELESDLPLVEALKRLRTDIVVASTPALAYVASEFLDPKIILVEQEHRATSQGSDRVLPLVAASRRVDCLVSLVEPSNQWILENYGSFVPRTAVIPNAIEPGLRPRASLDSKIVMVAARFAGGKNIPAIVNAFAQASQGLDGWRLRIYGDGPALDRIRGKITNREIALSVEVVSGLTDLRAEWGKASIAALASAAEGQGMVLMEAAAAGVPLVSYDSPMGPRSIVNDSSNGFLVPAGNQEALSAALRELMINDDLRKKMGVAALESSERFSLETVGPQWLRLFDSLKNASPRGSTRLSRAHAYSARNEIRVGLPEPKSCDEDASSLQVRSEMGLNIFRATLQRLHLDKGITVVEPQTGETPDFPPVILAPNGLTESAVNSLVDAFSSEFTVRLVSKSGELYSSNAGTDTPVATWALHAADSVELLDPLTAIVVHRALIWQKVSDSRLIASQTNPRVGSLPVTVNESGEFELTAEALQLFERRHWSNTNFPIDVVYTWVDGSDPVVAQDRREALGLDSSQYASDAVSEARYTNRDELKYSLRSIEKYAPWVRNIYIVTDRQRPDWLESSNERVRIVDHRDIFPDHSVLPVFNSHAIETALHRIPGLSEHFLYMNDDVLFTADVWPEDFFTHAGLPKVHFSPVKISEVTEETPHLLAANNNRRLLEEFFGVTMTNSLLHVPHSHRVSYLQTIEEQFPEVIEQTRASKFRSPSDYSLLSSLAQHIYLARGNARSSAIRYSYLALSNPRLGDLLKRVEEQRPYTKVVAIGEPAEETVTSMENSTLLFEYLQRKFPKPSQCEREPDAVQQERTTVGDPR